MNQTFWIWLLASMLTVVLASPRVFADQQCGDTGVWVQFLGAGGPEIDDEFAGASYLVWHNNKARVMIDTGPGAAVAIGQADANFADLEVIAYTHLHADHSSDFPALAKGARFIERTEPLPVLGPDSNNPSYPSLEDFVLRMIGPEGAFAYLQDMLTFRSSAGFKINPRNVPSSGTRTWSQFGRENLRLSSIPVTHGDVPALAWRVDIEDKSVVFTGDFNNTKNIMPEFAKDTDALVVSHAIPENSRGRLRELHVLPTQIGRIAEQANARLVMLTKRMNRTRGRESQSREHIEKNYSGYVLFANDLECWGL